VSDVDLDHRSPGHAFLYVQPAAVVDNAGNDADTCGGQSGAGDDALGVQGTAENHKPTIGKDAVVTLMAFGFLVATLAVGNFVVPRLACRVAANGYQGHGANGRGIMRPRPAQTHQDCAH
jgi:hypothetical protein